VYISDVESKTVEEALQITYSQSKKLLPEYGLDFRFLLDELLVKNPKDKTPTPFTFQAEPIIRQDPMLTPRIPTPTPSVKSPVSVMRSPAPSTPSSSSIRSRMPQQQPASALPPTSLASPQPRRMRSPLPEASPRLGARAAPQNSTNDQARTPKSARSSPAPPGPRSMNRPGSSAGQRPPPVAVPRREGMI